MKVAQFRRTGDPSVLEVATWPAPRPPRGDELLVQVEASSINGTDLGLRRGEVPLATAGRLPVVPGFDLVGHVLACGPAVTAFDVGDRVVALLGHGGGGQAEQVLLRQGRAAWVPDSWAPETAAALPLAGLTTLQALHGRAALHHRPGARVLVVGASGGIGTFAVQLAVLAGARVTGTASAAKHEIVAGLGAHTVIDHHTTDVLDLPQRWDVVMDAAGVLDVARARRVLSPGGVVVTTRPASPRVLTAWAGSALRAAGRRAVRRDAAGGSPAGRVTAVTTQARSGDLARLVSLVEAGRLVPVVDRSYPLEEVAEAHRRAEGPAVGKVVVLVAASGAPVGSDLPTASTRDASR